MNDRFQSSFSPKLQNAYGAWATKLADSQIAAICLDDPEHTMAAFFGICLVGRPICVVAQSSLVNLGSQFATLTQKLVPQDNSPAPSQPSDFLTFTSGSTSSPKAILRSQKSWIYSFSRNGVTSNDTVAILGHLAHSLALYAACEAIHIGADVIFCGTREQGNPSVVYSTPTLLKIAYKNSEIKPRVRLVMIGGGHFSADDRLFCQEKFPNAEVKVFYGTAETSFITLADKDTPNGSVGKAYDGVTVRAPNGEIQVCSPMMATGYFGQIDTIDKSKPFATGELGWIDNDGFVFLHGRSDRAVTISDKTVHLDELEAELLKAANIQLSGVVALPDAKRGMRAYAAVTGGTAQHPQIAKVVTLSEWPRLLSGKTDYVRLTQILAKACL
jgi:long-chain acyl-CoA synthetase